MIKKLLNYSLFTLVIFISGNPFFGGQQWILFSFFLLLCLVFINNIYIKFSKEFIFIFLLFFSIELIHLIFEKNSNLTTFLGTFLRLLLAYFFVFYFKFTFYNYYVRILYFLSIMSIFIFTISFYPPIYLILLSISSFTTPLFAVDSSIYEMSPTIIFYTLHPLHVFRNCGPFWEPGGFSVFLLIGLSFTSFLYGFKFNKYVLVFIISILTTFSTLGYLGLLVYFLFYLYNYNVKFKYKFFIYFIAVFGFGLIILNFDFLGDKIIHNIEVANETTGSRFGSALADFDLISNSPIIGNGRGFQKYGIDDSNQFEMEFHRNNGLTNIIVLYGIPFFLILIYIFYNKYFIKDRMFLYNSSFSCFFILILILCFFTQILFLRPFILSLLFLPIRFIYAYRFNNSYL